MSKHTIFVYDTDTCETIRVTMEYKPEHIHDVWLHVLRDRLDDQTIQREHVAEMIEELGEDMMDYNIVAVIPGDVVPLDLPDDNA